ncbi:MAG: HlyC/CorC family transporter [Acidobacteria bacterium]|nr:HlyC/CorC family transporter [Acidobacteriota bacterium]
MDQTVIVMGFWIVALAALLVCSSVASYLRLLMRRLTPVAALKLFQTGTGRRIQPDRERVGVSISALHGAAMALFAVGLTGLLLFSRPDHPWENLGTSLLLVLGAVVFCDQLIPFMLVARHDNPEVILEHWLPYLRKAVFIALPLTFPILISTTVARLLEPPEEKPVLPSSQRSLEELFQVGEAEGAIGKGEGKLLRAAMKFGDKTVREVMTPRPEIAAIEINAPVEDLRKLFREHRYTRYPVYSGQIDRIEGIVTVRDLMGLSPEEQAMVRLASLLRPVAFVPETNRIRDLLKELQQSTMQIAVAIDEYGSVAGLVTIEDLLEEIVGEIRDEVEPHARDIVKESATSYLVAGHTELAQLAEQLHVAFEGRDYSTVAGLLLFHLGHVPLPGEKVEQNGVILEVLESDPRTVLKVRLQLSTAAPQSASTHARPLAN